MSGKYPADSSRLIPANPSSSPLCHLVPTPWSKPRRTRLAASVSLEIYDIDSAGDAMLANISTRGLVQTGDEAMIGGFILQGGTEESTVVVRAIGPSLTSFGIGNALADPTLELHDANGALIQANDNWRDDAAQADELIAIGFAPGNDLESAMVATLPPSAYTAIVAGKGAAPA